MLLLAIWRIFFRAFVRVMFLSLTLLPVFMEILRSFPSPTLRCFSSSSLVKLLLLRSLLMFAVSLIMTFPSGLLLLVAMIGGLL